MSSSQTSPPSGRIFISYRREETAYPAGWLYARLKDRYGPGQVFKDVDSVQLGDDFVEVITRAVASCDVLLAMIGDEWTTVTDTHGRRRLDDPNDFVRVEVEAALGRNVRVIPVLVDGARMPLAEEVPPSLARLVRRQALELSPSRFDFDTGRLLKVLDATLVDVRSAGAAPTPTPSEPTTTQGRAPGPNHHTGQPVARPASGSGAVWALMPAMSLGLLTPVPFAHAAMRLHERRLRLVAAAYALLWVLLLAVNSQSGGESGAAGTLWLALIVVACLHAWRLRDRVFAAP